MVEIFKTGVTTPQAARQILKKLMRAYPGSRVHIDLDDCDKVLRIETKEKNIEVLQIIKIFKKCDLYCEILNG